MATAATSATSNSTSMPWQSRGADTQPISTLIDGLRAGLPFAEALAASGAPDAAQRFSTATMAMVERGDLIEIAAAFTFGREAIIPSMFRPLIRRVDASDGGEITEAEILLRRAYRARW